jgi:hypothetical protein
MRCARVVNALRPRCLERQAAAPPIWPHAITFGPTVTAQLLAGRWQAAGAEHCAQLTCMLLSIDCHNVHQHNIITRCGAELCRAEVLSNMHSAALRHQGRHPAARRSSTAQQRCARQMCLHVRDHGRASGPDARACCVGAHSQAAARIMMLVALQFGIREQPNAAHSDALLAAGVLCLRQVLSADLHRRQLSGAWSWAVCAHVVQSTTEVTAELVRVLRLHCAAACAV